MNIKEIYEDKINNLKSIYLNVIQLFHMNGKITLPEFMISSSRIINCPMEIDLINQAAEEIFDDWEFSTKFDDLEKLTIMFNELKEKVNE